MIEWNNGVRNVGVKNKKNSSVKFDVDENRNCRINFVKKQIS